MIKLISRLLKKDKHEDKNDATHSTCSNCSCENKQTDRRTFLKTAAGSAGVGASLMAMGATPLLNDDIREKAALSWEEYFQKNYRLMTKREKRKAVKRLEKLAKLRRNETVQISDKGPIPGVLFGYAFNISQCQGYMDCIKACVEENNLDRSSDMQYIKVFEMKNGNISFDEADAGFYHEVPQDGNFYMGTQCMHCENPPCVPVCPTMATWKEEDGIVVIDYNWCIGCRYCEAACPYFARRFNWTDPQVPQDELNPVQHYLGNRSKMKGVMEKCTFCVQKTRNGENPACVEACPTGARVFGNLLDPNSEIRHIIENKKVFRLKEELGTEPKFWYYMD
ncbi:MAG: 4Fe-4S dicluster domain-containing protein [Halobacteriovoraceae bacterium]|nr:4Fe-4S dicluster domain-containing protein [Halobacteriovoraceae bacterium]